MVIAKHGRMKPFFCVGLLIAAGCNNYSDDQAVIPIGTNDLAVATGALVTVRAHLSNGVLLRPSQPSIVAIVSVENQGGITVPLARAVSPGSATIELVGANGKTLAFGDVTVRDATSVSLVDHGDRQYVGEPGDLVTVRRAVDSVVPFTLSLHAQDGSFLQGRLLPVINPGADAITTPAGDANQVILTPTAPGEHVVTLRIGERAVLALHDVGLRPDEIARVRFAGDEANAVIGATTCIDADARDATDHHVFGFAWPWRAGATELGTGDSLCYTYAPDAPPTTVALQAPGDATATIHGSDLRVRVPGER